MQGGSQFREELQRHHLPSYMVNLRLSLIHMQEYIMHVTSFHLPHNLVYFDKE